MPNSKTAANKIRAWMSGHSREHVDPATGEINCTKLAEACADALGHDEWLDDSRHVVWEIALEFAEDNEP